MTADESEPVVQSGGLGQRPVPRPAHRSAANIALVATGGAVGTGIRYGLTLVLPPVQGVPVAILTVNVVGAFVLGILLETLSEFGPDHGLSRRLRLGVGTGVLGGLTTYSTLAIDTVTLVLLSPAIAVGYGVGTVIFGAIASVAGIGLGRRLVRPMLRRQRLS